MDRKETLEPFPLESRRMAWTIHCNPMESTRAWIYLGIRGPKPNQRNNTSRRPTINCISLWRKGDARAIPASQNSRIWCSQPISSEGVHQGCNFNWNSRPKARPKKWPIKTTNHWLHVLLAERRHPSQSQQVETLELVRVNHCPTRRPAIASLELVGVNHCPTRWQSIAFVVGK